jgi:uncharacterized membrane protein
MENRESENRNILLSKVTILIFVITAALFVAIGGVLYIIDYGSLTKSYSTFNAVDNHLRNPEEIIQNVISINPRSLIQFGILILISVPVIRVIIFLFSFIIQRDWFYSVTTFIILSVLLFSFFGS